MAVSFPKDAEILWDRTPLSNPIVLKYSDVFTFFILTGKDVFNFIKFLSEGHGGIELQGKVLHVSEMTPLQRNALNNSIFAKSCKFSLVLNSDYNDRNSNASMITIPIKAVLPTDSLTNSNQFEYENFRAQLEKSIRISKTFALKNYFRVRGTGKGTSISALNELSGSIKFEALAPDINIRCTPLRPIPILATPLSVMLMSTSLSSSAVPNFGYLSLNQTRKVVFLNDNDPGITVTPTVGVWVRYDNNYKNSELVDDAIFHPYSWLACLRFIQNESLLKDYILDGNTFLLAILINEFISYFEITPVSAENTGTFTPMARLQDYKLNLVDLDFTVDLRADANANFDDDVNNNIAPHRDRSVVCKFKRVVSPANKSMKASPTSPYVANTASLMSSMTPVEGSELFPRGFSIQPIASPSHPSSSAKMISSIEKLRSSNEIIESKSPNLKPTGGKPATSVFYKLETASNTSLNPSISRSQEFQSTKSQGIPAPIEIVRSSSNNLLSPSAIKQKSSDDPSISSIITPQNEDSAYSMKRFTISNNPTTPRVSKTPSTDALRNSKNGGTDLFQLVIQQHNEINELRNYINTLRRIILDLDGDYPDFQLCEDIHVGPSENQFEKNDQVIHEEDSLVLQSLPKSDPKQESSMNNNNNNNNNSNSNPAHLITNLTENQLEDTILPKYVNAEDRLEIRNFLDVDERDEKMEAYRNSIEGISKNLLHLNNQSGGDSISSIGSNNKKNNQKGAKTVLFQDHVHKSIQKPVTKPFHLLQNAKILMEMPSTIQESESIIAIQQKYL